MSQSEYLLGYGVSGEFGRFQPAAPCLFRRGERLVVRSRRGIEIGVVLRPSDQGHIKLLADQHVGKILRRATTDDEAVAERMCKRGELLFAESRKLAEELCLPLQVLDVEVLLDNRQAIVHYLRSVECDPRPLMDRLSDDHQVLVTMHDLSLPAAKDSEGDVEAAGCGGSSGCTSGGCGSCQSGQCSSCVSRSFRPPRTPPADHCGLVAAI